MGSKRRSEGKRAKRRASPTVEIDHAKVERLRAALARGDFSMDFEMLIERLVHAMRT
jgi:anti-sigma28 factor (negative regulator of flagellin synthesis)